MLQMNKFETCMRNTIQSCGLHVLRRITKPITDVSAVISMQVDQNGRTGGMTEFIISTHSAAGVPPNAPERVNQTASSRCIIANYLAISSTRFQTSYQPAPSQRLHYTSLEVSATRRQRWAHRILSFDISALVSRVALDSIPSVSHYALDATAICRHYRTRMEH